MLIVAVFGFSILLSKKLMKAVLSASGHTLRLDGSRLLKY